MSTAKASLMYVLFVARLSKTRPISASTKPRTATRNPGSVALGVAVSPLLAEIN